MQRIRFGERMTALCGAHTKAALAVALSGGFLLTAGCSNKVAIVKAAQAEMEPITRTVSTNGKVELTDDFHAVANSTAQVKQVLVKVGDHVQAGQQLLRMDDADALLHVGNAQAALVSAQNGFRNLNAGGTAEELLNEKADMTALQTTMQQAQARFSSLQQLQNKGAASANEVAAAQTQVTETQNRIDALRARQAGRFSSGDLANQREQVVRSRDEVAAAQQNLAGFEIRAPFAGTVYGVNVVPYQTVNAGEDLINLADLSRIRVRAYFDEPEIGRLAVGQPVRITWEAKPERVWQGHIAATPTSITNAGTRNVGECLITVDDARGDLLPNVNVTVNVTTLHRDNVLSIPREALRTEAGGNYVYRIAGGQLERVKVQVDVVSQTRVQITSGLRPGDQVVLVPLNDVELKSGTSVKVQP